MADMKDQLLGFIAALGIGASGGAAATAALTPSSTPAPVTRCADGWRETTDRVPASALPGATFTGTRVTTTCVGPDGKIIVLDNDGNVANALDEKGAPLAAPRSYLP